MLNRIITYDTILYSGIMPKHLHTFFHSMLLQLHVKVLVRNENIMNSIHCQYISKNSAIPIAIPFSVSVKRDPISHAFNQLRVSFQAKKRD